MRLHGTEIRTWLPKPQAATLIVAASNSLYKERADYVCDGTDDQVEINAAIAALPAGGGRVLLLEGLFNISAPINLVANMTLEGQGWSSTKIYLVNLSDCHMIVADTVDNIRITGLRLDGNKSGQTQKPYDYTMYGIYLRYSDFSQVDHNYIENVTQYGIQSQYSDFGNIANNHIYNIGDDTVNDGDGIEVSGGHDNTVRGNIIRNAFKSGIEMEGGYSGTVIGNVIYTYYYDPVGIQLNVGSPTAHASMTVVGNTIRGRTAGQCRGIWLEGGNYGAVIANNTIIDVTYGIKVDSYLTRPNKDIIIIGNQISLLDPAGTTYSVENGIYAVGLVANNIEKLIIANNTITEAGKASIHLDYVDGAVIEGNAISDGGTESNLFGAIDINRSQNISIQGNDVNGQLYNVDIDSGCSQVVIRGNNLRNAGTAAINNAAADTLIYEEHSDLFMDVLAVSANYIRNNEDLSAAIPITFTIDAQPDVPRTLSFTLTNANITAFTLEIVGVNAKGQTVTETFTEAGGFAQETSEAYATVTSIRLTARTGTGAGDLGDVGITDVLGLSNLIYATGDVYKIKKNNANAVVAGAQVNTTYDTYDMAVIGLAVGDDFTIWYRSNLNIIT